MTKKDKKKSKKVEEYKYSRVEKLTYLLLKTFRSTLMEEAFQQAYVAANEGLYKGLLDSEFEVPENKLLLDDMKEGDPVLRAALILCKEPKNVIEEILALKEISGTSPSSTPSTESQQPSGSVKD